MGIGEVAAPLPRLQRDGVILRVQPFRLGRGGQVAGGVEVDFDPPAPVTVGTRIVLLPHLQVVQQPVKCGRT